MANTGAFYQKYGGFDSPDMKSLVAGQEAVGRSIGEAFKGVEELFKQTEESYKETNTLNMQEYLQNKLKKEGLGVDPLDKTAVTRQFGNTINMDKLTETYAGTKQQLETNAINLASNEALTEAADPLKQRQLFEQRLREQGAPESLVSAANQSFAATNATRFQDYEIQKTRESSARTNSLFEEVQLNGPAVGRMAIKALVAELPEEERVAETRKLTKELEEQLLLTPDQQEKHKHYVALQEGVEKRKIQLKLDRVAELEQQDIALQRTGISDDAYAQVKTVLGNDFGASVPQAIGKKVTNWVEGWAPKSDAKEVARIHQEMLDSKVEAKDAGAALYQAFSEHYPGDRAWGNDISADAMRAIEARAKELGENAKNRFATSGELMSARQEATAAQQAAEETLLRLSKELRDAGAQENFGGAGPGIDGVGLGRGKTVYGDNAPTSANPRVIAGVDISRHATDPNHENKVQELFDTMPPVQSVAQIDQYIQATAPNSPITGAMVSKYAKQYDVEPKLLMAMMQQDSSFGTTGKGARTRNPGNVGNDDTGKEVTFASWEEGIEAEAKWLAKNRVAKEAPGEKSPGTPASETTPDEIVARAAELKAQRDKAATEEKARLDAQKAKAEKLRAQLAEQAAFAGSREPWKDSTDNGGAELIGNIRDWYKRKNAINRGSENNKLPKSMNLQRK